MFTPDKYRREYGIDFNKLQSTRTYEQREGNALGYEYLYEASATRLILTSLPDPDFDDEPRYIMAAEINRLGQLTPTLITTTESKVYYPIFNAKGFIDIALLYFSERIRNIKLDYINSRYIHTMYDQFFSMLDLNNNDPERAFRQTTIAKRIIENGYTNVSAASSNDYQSPLDGDILTFWLSK